jgi:hypothetical protein
LSATVGGGAALVDDAYERFKSNTEGRNSDVYPSLAAVPSAGDGALCIQGRVAPANLVDGAHASRVGVSILSHSQDRIRVRPPPPKSVIGHLGAQLLSHRNEIDAAGGDLSKIEAACKRFNELEGYLYSNIRSLTDYGRACRQGERIATANIESTGNQLVNQRMCKVRPYVRYCD